MSLKTRAIVISSIIGFAILSDQVTKQIAIKHLKGAIPISYWDRFFVFQYAENIGAMLGFGSDLPDNIRFWLLTVSVGVLLTILLGYIYFSKNLTNGQVIALAFIAGGGLSNFIDRVVNDGRVVDFMNMGIGDLRTGIFNVADVLIMCGLGLMLIYGEWTTPKTPAETEEESASPPASKDVDVDPLK